MVGALEDRVGALEDWSPQETRSDPVPKIGLEPLRLVPLNLQGWSLGSPSRCLAQYRFEPGRLEYSSRVGALYHYCTLLIVKKKLIKASIPSLFILCSKYKRSNW